MEVDQIYHLACPASPIFYKYNPVKVRFRFFSFGKLLFFSYPSFPWEVKSSSDNIFLPLYFIFFAAQTIKTNVMGTLNMLGLAKRVGARSTLKNPLKVVLFSPIKTDDYFVVFPS